MAWITLYAKFPGECEICKNKINVGDLIEWDKDTSKARHNGCAQEIDEIKSLKEKALNSFVAGDNSEGMQYYNEASKLEFFSLLEKHDTAKKIESNDDTKTKFKNALEESDLRKNAQNFLEFPKFFEQFKELYLSLSKAIFGEETYTRVMHNLSKPDKQKAFEHEIALNFFIKWQKLESFTINPDSPDKNRRYFRHVLSRCQGYIHWVDKYFSRESLEFLLSGYNPKKVNEIKLLGSVFSKQIDLDLKKDVEKLQNEMKNENTTCELRIITSKDFSDDFHNRYIIGSNIAWDAPSIGQITQNQSANLLQLTQYKEYQEKFRTWWEHESCLDLVQEWDKIDQILNEQGLAKSYIRNCSICGQETRVPPHIIQQKKSVSCTRCRRS